MEIYIAAAVIFVLVFLCLAIGRFRGRHCLNCSCESSKQIMNSKGHAHLVDLVDEEPSCRQDRAEIIKKDDH